MMEEAFWVFVETAHWELSHCSQSSDAAEKMLIHVNE